MSFRGTRVVHHQCDPCVSEPIPMRKPPTGEPCAGEPHARFGGRGRRKPFPTPIGSGLPITQQADPMITGFKKNIPSMPRSCRGQILKFYPWGPWEVLERCKLAEDTCSGRGGFYSN